MNGDLSPGEPGPSLGFWSHIEAQLATPTRSTQVPFAKNRAVLKAGRDSDRPAASAPSGGPRPCAGPSHKKIKKIRQKSFVSLCFFLFFSLLEDSALANNYNAQIAFKRG